MSDFLIEKYLPKFYRQFSTTITSDYILSPGDAGSTVIADSSSNIITVEVPNDLVVNFAVGTVIWIYRDGSNPVVIKGDTGVTVNPSGVLIKSDHAEVHLRKQAANEWVVGNNSSFSGFIRATGGTVNDITVGGVDYRVHTFTTVGTSTFNVTSGGRVEYLVVGGGGGGGSGTAGGGGAGGYRSSVSGELSGGNNQAESLLQVQTKTYNITVGAGGLGGTPDSREPSNGQNSSIDNEIISLGGGAGGEGDAGGGKNRSAGQTGGSGGGGWQYSGDSRTFGAGTAGQGFDGGNFGGTEGGGGGGGAGQAGQDNGGGDGGDGLESSIDGTPTYRAGGGGGGVGSSGGAGGLGGGASSTGGSNNQASGAANTGGGGAGGWTYASGDGGNGGSGIVIIRYPI